MPKNIVMLFDGTSNEISADRTNILRLFGALSRDKSQIVYYDPGVGTFGAANAWFRPYRKSIEVWGLATGWGIDENVKEAYRFLVENYRIGPSKAQSDRIYLFGFSRGAYTARVLAGFVHALGLMSRHQINLLDYAYRTYKGIPQHEERHATSTGATTAPDIAHPLSGPTGGGEAGEKIGEASGPPVVQSAFATMRLYERTLRTFRPPIKLLGLFDTVASVIEMGKVWPQLKTHPFTVTNPSVEHVRHAVGIDERRTMFQPLLWEPGREYWGGPFRPKQPVAQDLREVWFAGVHGDVGGGNPEAESGLAKIPLDWMIRETRPLGLSYIDATVDEIVLGRTGDSKYVAPDPHAMLHDTMKAAWPLVEVLPRRISALSWRRTPRLGGFYLPLCDRRKIPPAAFVHASVLARLAGPTEPPYRPANLQPLAVQPAPEAPVEPTPAPPPPHPAARPER